MTQAMAWFGWYRLGKALCLLLLVATWSPGSAHAAGGFVAGLEDVPLMPGFATVPDSTTVFDKPGGRIVESYANGAASPDAVIAFYDRALQQLGWLRLRPGRFSREGEVLQIDIVGHDGTLTVRYALAPQP